VADAENLSERRYQILIENARLFLDNDELNNIVDKEKWF
ncbi:MAG TPA: D-2-hydroxyacid dehydrogenase, partial [Dehalococcoidia bacterium]|nr:D-2-hydroxyacid dehydrogenase [Dehalococcoidia bacterium]